MSVPCGKRHPERQGVLCDRWTGHGGKHWSGAGHVIQWGGPAGKGTYEKVNPLPPGKQLAPFKAPAAPGYAKFRDTPGQQMLSLDDDDPQRLDPVDKEEK